MNIAIPVGISIVFPGSRLIFFLIHARKSKPAEPSLEYVGTFFIRLFVFLIFTRMDLYLFQMTQDLS